MQCFTLIAPVFVPLAIVAVIAPWLSHSPGALLHPLHVPPTYLAFSAFIHSLMMITLADLFCGCGCVQVCVCLVLFLPDDPSMHAVSVTLLSHAPACSPASQPQTSNAPHIPSLIQPASQPAIHECRVLCQFGRSPFWLGSFIYLTMKASNWQGFLPHPSRCLCMRACAGGWMRGWGCGSSIWCIL